MSSYIFVANSAKIAPAGPRNPLVQHWGTKMCFANRRPAPPCGCRCSALRQDPAGLIPAECPPHPVTYEDAARSLCYISGKSGDCLTIVYSEMTNLLFVSCILSSDHMKAQAPAQAEILLLFQIIARAQADKGG